MNETQAVTQKASPAAQGSVQAEFTGPLGTILVVEDEAFVREVTCEILECEGYRVLKARNASEARIAFRRYRKVIRLLLTDVVLPGENGRDLARDLRFAHPDLPTVFVSGYPQNIVTQGSPVENGMFYLPKPFCAESLIQKVRQALAPKRKEKVV